MSIDGSETKCPGHSSYVELWNFVKQKNMSKKEIPKQKLSILEILYELVLNKLDPRG